MKQAIRLGGFLIVMMATSAQAQERLTLQEACSYYGEAISDDVYGFASDNEAEAAVKRIVDHTGLPQNFKIIAANVPNAAADVTPEGDRRILYSQTFMKRITETAKTDWAAVSILAHEIGHHLSGHTLKKGGSRPEIELQADTFSGYVLYKMNARLEEAQAAMDSFADDVKSETHPPKSARLAAIANGWTKARDQNSQSAERARPVSTTETEADSGRVSEHVENSGLEGRLPTGSSYTTQCSFHDGSGVAIDQNNQVVTFWNGATLAVGTRRPSSYPGVQYELFLHSDNAYIASLLSTLGVLHQTYYVNSLGQIWRTDTWGNVYQIGACQ